MNASEFLAASVQQVKAEKRLIELLSDSDKRREITSRMSMFLKQKPEKGCWLWGKFRHVKHYGKFTFDGFQMPSHRACWICHFGEIPTGLLVLHRCDVHPCCNPSHLFLGTDQDNAKDRNEKGRQAIGPANGMSKVDEDSVRRIRFEYRLGSTLSQIGRMFSIHRATVHKIVIHQTWKHVKNL